MLKLARNVRQTRTRPPRNQL